MLRGGACAALASAGLLAAAASQAAASCGPRYHGFNLIPDEHAPLSRSQSFANLKELRGTGANAVAIVPLLQQSSVNSPDVNRIDGMSDGELAHEIRQAHRLKLEAIVKPRIEIPGGEPDAVRMTSDKDWSIWFHHYQQALVGLAAVAADEHAEALVIGTDLDQTLSRPEWKDLIARLRRVYHGRLVYAAQGAAGAERVPFWHKLDAVGATLYPARGTGDDPQAWGAALADESSRLVALAKQAKRPVFIAELGFHRTSAVTRQADSTTPQLHQADETIEAHELATWLAQLSAPSIQTVLVWRWNSAPAGGAQPASFAVQGTPAEQAVARQWQSCKRIL